MSYLDYIDTAEYQNYTGMVLPAVDAVKESDSDFYRMEKMFTLKMSEPMLFGYDGLSHYSSTEKDFVKGFMGQAGFTNHGNWSYYNRGSTYAMDSLLGVRYLLSMAPLGYPYEWEGECNGISIYKNPYALPIGFLASENIGKFHTDIENKFEMQNRMWRALSAKADGDIFKEQSIDGVELKNLKEPDSNGYYYPKNTKKKSSITYTFTAESDNPVFLYLNTDEMKQVEVWVNENRIGRYFHPYEYDILRLGSFKRGEEVKVKIKVKKKRYINITDAWFYYQDMEAFEKYYADLYAGGIFLDKISDSDLKGEFFSTGEKEFAFFTIPYEESWHVYIDGKRAETFMSADTFLTVRVPEGSHNIELRYIPKGVGTGTVITLLSIVLCIIWTIKRKNVKQ